MNIYKLHSDPDSLDHCEDAQEYVTKLAWEKYEKQPNELKRRGLLWARDAEMAYWYAKDVLKRPFPKGENAIAENAGWAYYYAKNILKGPFPKGEDAIAKNTGCAYLYALNVLKGPFPKGEVSILNSIHCERYQAFIDSFKCNSAVLSR